MFDFIWPARDSAFESYFMVEESSESNVKRKDYFKQRVKKTILVLVPGLRVYNYDRSLVDYSGFTKGDEEELGNSSLVAQAVVTTK